MAESAKTRIDKICRISSAILIFFIFFSCFLYALPRRDKTIMTTQVSYTENFLFDTGKKANIWNMVAPDEDGIDIYCTVEKLNHNSAIYFLTEDTYVTVYYNGIKIFEDDTTNDIFSGLSNGSCWRKIQVWNSQNPVSIKIHCKPAYSNLKCVVKSVYIGDVSACEFHVLTERVAAVFFNIIFITIGIVCIILYVIHYFRYHTGRDFLFIGVSTLSTALWSLFDTTVFQYFWGNSNIFLLISYLLTMTIPISFGLICAYRFTGKYKLVSHIYTLISEVNIFIACALYLTDLADFHYTIWGTKLLIIIGIPLLCKLVFTYQEDGKVFRNKVVISTFVFMVIACTIMWFLRLRLGYVHDESYITRTAIICFQVCLIVLHSKTSATFYRNKFEEQIRHEFAIKDRVTGFYNRTGLMENQSKYLNSNGKCNCGIAFFSLRHVKRINERYGYEEGTKLIQEFTSGLHSSFPDSCDFYRIGSRNFFIFISGNEPEEIYVDARTSLEVFCNEINDFRVHEYTMEYKTSFAFDKDAALFDLMDVIQQRV